MSQTSGKYEAQHNDNVEIYKARIDKIFLQATKEAAAIGASLDSVNPDKPFQFKDYRKAQIKIEALVRNMKSDIQAVVVNGVKSEWTLANNKNNALCDMVFAANNMKLTKEEERRYYTNNSEAQAAFLARKESGLNLSDRVWNYTNQFKNEIELGLDIGIRSGQSAQSMAKDLQQYLKFPDKLFRRVRDAHGNLQLSKAAKAFHPGQGVYRSSHKNALRLTGTECNIAYRRSDQMRWSDMYFVVGFEVHLSNNHTVMKNGKRVPLRDICDDLQGRYPKTFIFSGWHPNCRCYVTSVLMTEAEMRANTQRRLKGLPVNKQSVNEVKDVPENFKKWAKDNASRISQAKKLPYFIRDNSKYFPEDAFSESARAQIAQAEKFNETMQPEEPAAPTALDIAEQRHAARTPEQAQGIRDAWAQRKANIKLATDALADATKYHIAGDQLQALQQAAYNGQYGAVSLKKSIAYVQTTIADLNGLKYIKNPLQVAQDFSAKTAMEIEESVKKKIDQWDDAAAHSFENKNQYLQKKVQFEIDYVEQQKKYPSWQVAQDAYKSYLSKVQDAIIKDSIISTSKEAYEYLTANKVTGANKMLNEYNALKNNPEAENIAFKLAADKLQEKYEAALKAEDKKIKKLKPITFKESTQAERDAAFWAKTKAQQFEADEKLRPITSKYWIAASEIEKNAAYNYTCHPYYINEPLRGITYSGMEENGIRDINAMTSFVKKGKAPENMWLQRGVDIHAMESMLGKSLSNDKDFLSQLANTQIVEKGFASCGTCKSTGFDSKPVILNIYCPKGTRMMYFEPFSNYGNGGGRSWDGLSKQSSFGSEFETVLLRGSQFKILKVEYDSDLDKYYFDVEVIGQLQ
jgi:hypothetical protein